MTKVVECCIDFFPAQHVQVQGAPILSEGKHTFYDLERLVEDEPVFHFGLGTEAILHPPRSSFTKVQVIDLCSGMGGFTIGSQVLGMQTVAYVEKNELQ